MVASDFRKDAREHLNGNWKMAISVSLIYAAITFIIGLLGAFTFGLLSIAETVAFTAIIYGLAYTYYHLRNGDKVSYFDFLKVGFKNFGRSWGILGRILLKCIVPIVISIVGSIIFIVVLAAYGVTSSVFLNSIDANTSYKYDSSLYDDYYDNYKYDYDDYYSDDYLYEYNKELGKAAGNIALLSGLSIGVMVLLILFVALYIGMSIWLMVKSLLYVLAYYIAVDNEDMTPKEIVEMSENLMKGNRGRYFCLMLSFIGWFLLIYLATVIIGFASLFILTSIVFNIGVAILTPYIIFASLSFYEQMKIERGVAGNVGNGHQGINQNINTYVEPNVNAYTAPAENQNVNAYTAPTENQNVNAYTVPTENQSVNTYTAPNNNEITMGINTQENNMKICPNCGKENSKDASFCMQCGRNL